MNRNKKTKNVKMNKNIEYIELTNSFDTTKAIDNKDNKANIHNSNGSKKETNSFS